MRLRRIDRSGPTALEGWHFPHRAALRVWRALCLRNAPRTLAIASMLVAAGIAFNRTNVVLLAMNIKGPMPQFGPEIYFPSLVEWGISIGLIAATIFLFGLAARLVPLLQSQMPVDPEPAGHAVVTVVHSLPPMRLTPPSPKIRPR